MSTGAPLIPEGQLSQVAWDQLVAQQAATERLLSAHERLSELLGRLSHPAQEETLVIGTQNDGSTRNPVESRERFQLPTLSVGMLNPNNLTIYFSGVGSASPNMRAYSCPPNALIVLPLSAGQIEVGCDPTALGTSTAIVFLFRYFTVQPAFLGKGV